MKLLKNKFFQFGFSMFLLLLGGCQAYSSNYSAENIEAMSPTNESVDVVEQNTNDNQSKLSLQIGFDSPEIKYWGNKGATLENWKEAIVNGNTYSIIHLFINSHPRILTDSQNIILIYQNSNDKSKTFLAEINQLKSNQEDITNFLNSIPSQIQTDLDSHILSAYLASGFEIIGKKRSIDHNGNGYLAIAVGAGEDFFALTFLEAENGSLTFLNRFTLPQIPNEGESWGVWVNSELQEPLNLKDFSFIEIWDLHKSNIQPSNFAEMSLFALGCIIDDSSLGVIEGKILRSEGIDNLALYTCTLFADYGPPLFAQPYNFIAIFSDNDTLPNIYWNDWRKFTLFTSWQDVNEDGAFDLIIDEVFNLNSVYTINRRVLYVTSTGSLVNLLDISDNLEELFEGEGLFLDLNGDQIDEFVTTYRSPYAFGAFRAAGLQVAAIRGIYRLQDDLYYIPQPYEYSSFCEGLIEELTDSQKQSAANEGVRYVFSVINMLLTCETVGMRDPAWEVFHEETSLELYSTECNEWLREVRNSFSEYYENNISFWDTENLFFKGGGLFTWEMLEGCRYIGKG